MLKWTKSHRFFEARRKFFLSVVQFNMASKAKGKRKTRHQTVQAKVDYSAAVAVS